MTLEAKKITFWYRGKKKKPVLSNFDLTLSSGERVGLKAPSGRGKTTLCRILAGYERPQKGTVLLDGSPLRKAAGTYRGACPVQNGVAAPGDCGGSASEARDNAA